MGEITVGSVSELVLWGPAQEPGAGPLERGVVWNPNPRAWLPISKNSKAPPETKPGDSSHCGVLVGGLRLQEPSTHLGQIPKPLQKQL